MSTELATPGLLKIKISWKNDYEVIVYANGAGSKVLSHESSYIADELMLPNFGKSSIPKNLSKLHFYKDLTTETAFFEG